MSAQTEEECVRESLDIARADGRREMARATVALAVSVIDERTRERDDARAKIAAIVEAEAGLWATSAADGSYDAACRRWCDALDAVRDPANRGVALTSLPSRPDAREKLRALVEATDALDLAARLWMDGDRPTDEALDAAKDAHEAALAAARGAL